MWLSYCWEPRKSKIEHKEATWVNELHVLLTLSLDGGAVSLTLRPLYPSGKSPQYQLNRRLGEPHSSPWHFGAGKSFFLCWELNKSLAVQAQFGYYTESQLLKCKDGYSKLQKQRGWRILSMFTGQNCEKLPCWIKCNCWLCHLVAFSHKMQPWRWRQQVPPKFGIHPQDYMLLQSTKLYSDSAWVHSVSLTVVFENNYKTLNLFMSRITPSYHY